MTNIFSPTSESVKEVHYLAVLTTVRQRDWQFYIYL